MNLKGLIMKNFSPLHAERLDKLADYLENLDEKYFDLEVITDWNSELVTFNDSKELFEAFKNHSCGTTACAFGYMPVVFPENFYYTEAGWIVSRNHTDSLIGLCKFFGFPYHDFSKWIRFLHFSFLFETDSYVNRTAKDVAKRLRLVAKNYGYLVDDGNLGKLTYNIDDANDWLSQL